MKIRVEIYKAANNEFGFRVKGGNSRITLTPGETYKTRSSVRRAVRSLMGWSTPESVGMPSPLERACDAELAREQAQWNARRRTGSAS